MKKFYFLYTALALTVILNACNKNGLPAISHSSKALDTAVDVYVAGEGVTAAVLHQAVYWKNGIYNILNSNNIQARAYGIAVSGRDVYVSGIIDNLSAENAAYWKNGTLTRLSPDSAYSGALCVTTHGNDVYVGGFAGNQRTVINMGGGYRTYAVYWKNGVPVMLGDGVVSSIVIIGSDVYAVGGIENGSNTPTTYWKNGVRIPLLGASSANAIVADGNDVYIGGCMTGGVAAVWKNGVAIPLAKDGAPFETISYVNGLAVNGGNVFAAGVIVLNNNPKDTVDYSNYGNLAVLWKNTSPSIISASQPIASNPLNNLLSSVFVYGTDVYVTGQVANNKTQQFQSYYWKNGVPVLLSNGGGFGVYAKSIFVAPK